MDMLVASTFYDNSCELASCDAGRIDTHAVFLDSKTFVGIVTIEDCSPLVFWKDLLVFIPALVFSH